MRGKTVRWVALWALALLALSACGTDDGDLTGETEEADAAEADTDDRGAQDEDEGEDGAEGDEDASEEKGSEGETGGASDVLERMGSASATVTYEGEGRTSGAFEMTYAYDPPSMAAEFKDDNGETRIISAEGEDTVMCSLEDGDWQCMRLPSDDSTGVDMAQAYVFSPFDLSEIAADVADELSLSGSETIAGRSAECLSVPFVEDVDGRTDGETEVCVDTELGVALRVRAESDEGVLDGYEATEVSDTVDTDLFEPPAEPMDLGDFSG